MEIVIYQIVICVVAFGVFAWAIHKHCLALKKEKAKPRPRGDNVVDFASLKTRRCEDNLQMFLDADDALSKDQTERFFALYMKAIESTKRSMNEQKVGEKRVS